MENEIFEKAPVPKAFFTMALPVVFSMVISLVYNMVDTYFIARTGNTNLVAGVSLGAPIFTLMIALGDIFGLGGSSVISRLFGEKKDADGKRLSVFCFYGAILCGIVITALMLLFRHPILGLLGADTDTYTYASQYYTWLVLGAPFIIVALTPSNLLRTEGFAKASMIGTILGSVVNIILDPIMIFGLLGCPAMGVTGAAVATVIGQCVAAVVAFTCNHKFNTEIKIRFQGFRPDIKIIGTIYAIGVPSIIMQSIGSVMTYSMNRILIAFSSTATAVFGVYFKLQSFFFMPVFGLNNGITPIIAFNYGAQNRKRMIKTIKLSLITAFCLTFVGFLSFELIPQVLLGMFNASEDMLAIGIPALRIIGVHYLIAWFCIICGTVFQALGKAVYSMIVSILRQLVVLIPVAYLLSRIGGLHVVWWCFPIAEVASLVVSLTFLFSVNRQIISKIPDGSDIL